MTTDRRTLQEQYADGSSLDARGSIYRYQRERVDLPAEVVRRVPAGDGLVVDVGCGRGQYLAALRAAGRRAVGFDLSPGMIARAGPPGAVADAAGGLPLPGGRAAAALAMHMLYHLPDPAAGLRELRRIVRPGGAVLVVTNGADHLVEYRALLFEAAGRELAWPTSRFELEHRGLVEDVFGPVELIEWRSVVELDTVEPIVAYAASGPEFFRDQVDEPWPDVVERLRAVALPQRLSTHTGLFVAYT